MPSPDSVFGTIRNAGDEEERAAAPNPMATYRMARLKHYRQIKRSFGHILPPTRGTAAMVSASSDADRDSYHRLGRGMRSLCRILWSHGLDVDVILTHCRLLLPDFEITRECVLWTTSDKCLLADNVESDYEHVNDETRGRYPPQVNYRLNSTLVDVRSESHATSTGQSLGNAAVHTPSITNFHFVVMDCAQAELEYRSQRKTHRRHKARPVASAAAKKSRRAESAGYEAVPSLFCESVPPPALAPSAAAAEVTPGHSMNRGMRALCRILHENHVSDKAVLKQCLLLQPAAAISLQDVQDAIQNTWNKVSLHKDNVKDDYKFVSAETNRRFPPKHINACPTQDQERFGQSEEANRTHPKPGGVQISADGHLSTEEIRLHPVGASQRLDEHTSSRPSMAATASTTKIGLPPRPIAFEASEKMGCSAVQRNTALIQDGDKRPGGSTASASFVTGRNKIASSSTTSSRMSARPSAARVAPDDLPKNPLSIAAKKPAQTAARQRGGIAERGSSAAKKIGNSGAQASSSAGIDGSDYSRKAASLTSDISDDGDILHKGLSLFEASAVSEAEHPRKKRRLRHVVAPQVEILTLPALPWASLPSNDAPSIQVFEPPQVQSQMWYFSRLLVRRR